MDKFQNKYRISSARLQSWNYGWDAAYFITICTKNREHLFGEIRIEKEEILFQKTMKLSPIGIIADVLWHEMKNHAKNVELDAFVVMPNHIHGIVILNGNNDNISINNNGNGDGDGCVDNGIQPQTIGQQRYQNQGKNTISSIIGSYKSAVTKHANRLGLPHGWQLRFHDHIIRNNDEFNRIRNYIINNPSNWNEDRFNKGKEVGNE